MSLYVSVYPRASTIYPRFPYVSIYNVIPAAVLRLQLVSWQPFTAQAANPAGPGPEIHCHQLQGVEPAVVQGP